MNSLLKVLLVTSVFAVACDEDKTTPKANVTAPEKIEQAFSLKSVNNSQRAAMESVPGFSNADKAKVTIMTSALDKEFLLSSNILEQSPVPMFHNMRSRIVAFKKVDDRLLLIEANDGHIVREDIPAELILAQFEIIEEKEDQITFDFNAGMSRIFTLSGWHGSDYSAAKFDQHFQALPVRISYINHAELKNNRLYVQQYAQVAMDTQLKPMEVRYYVEPYRTNPNFKPTRGTDFQRMGFFETAPRFNEHGTQDIWATKFDHNEPITFAISANTPKEYQDAVRDGILYWNKAFGSEVVKAVVAPAGVTAPHPDYNVVQWVNWDTAGFAYADAQADPRTGEIKNAQVMFTSVFAIGGKRRARQLLNVLKDAPEGRQLVLLKNFGKTPLCHFEGTKELESTLHKILEMDDEKKIFEVSADYIREVVAHEIGHTLGLRHNFAGSLTSDLTSVNRDEAIEAYLKEVKSTDDMVTSSSTMEYNVFAESAIMGNQMRRAETKALPYDDAAIKYLYLGKEYKNSELPLFCTDSHVSKFEDCERFDLFSSRSEELLYNEMDRSRKLPRLLLEKFINAVDPRKGTQPKKLAEVTLSPKKEAAALLKKRANVMNLLSEKSSLLSVHRAYDIVDELNKEKVRMAQTSLIEADLNQYQGLGYLLKPLPADFVAKQYAAFEAMLKDDSNRKGKGAGGKGYEFSDEDVQTILSRVEAFYMLLEKELLLAYLKQLSSTKDLADTAMAEQLANVLEERSMHYILSTTGEKVVGSLKDDKGKVTPVELPQFTYDLEVRKWAVNLLRNGRAKAMSWGLVQNYNLKTAYNKMISEALSGKKLADVNPALVSAEVRDWVLEAKALSGGITGRSALAK